MLTPDVPLALTYDDVLLVPAASEVLPREVRVETRLSRGLPLNIPLVSSAMDTVTESNTAIAMAREGGLGVIHKNLSPTDQARHVARVKKAMTGVVDDPVTLSPNQTLRGARALMRENNISGLPVVDGGQVVGMLTDRDLRFERNLDRPVREVMTPDQRLVTCPPGTSLDAKKPALEAMGHRVDTLNARLKANAAERLANGHWQGAADPRSVGVALKE